MPDMELVKDLLTKSASHAYKIIELDKDPNSEINYFANEIESNLDSVLIELGLEEDGGE